MESEVENHLVDRAVQTEEEEDCVQITASLPELLQRISSYQRYKRFQLDISNQIEFCHSSKDGSTCSRTNPAHLWRPDKLRNVPVKMEDEKGPLGKPLAPLQQFQRSLHEQTSVWDYRSTVNSNVSLLHLPERISNIEQYLGVNQGGSERPKDLLTRVANLEMKLLAVEGRSYEYHHHQKVGNKSIPRTNKVQQ